MITKTITMTLHGTSPKTMSSNVQTSMSFELPRVGSFFMEAAMQALSLIRNKSQELCRDLMAQDPHRISYEKRKMKEDSTKYKQIIHEFRVRQGWEASR